MVVFIVLFIVDAIVGYWINSSMGYGIGLIKLSFLLLPIANFMFISELFFANKDGIGLREVGFFLLLIVNVMFGFNVYDQARYGVGPGFLAVVPLIFVIAINDLAAVLFYIRIQHPQGRAKVISYTVLIFISTILDFILALSFLMYLPIFL
jgi:hypothetical protein